MTPSGSTHLATPPRASATGEADATRSAPLATWHLFAFVALGNLLALAFYNQAILTDDVYAQILGGLSEGRLDEYLGRARKMEWVSYVLTPAMLALRFAFVALMCQLVLLLVGIELKFGQVFRAATWAGFALLAQLVAQVGILAMLDPATLTATDLQMVPGSLSAILLGPDAYGTPLYALLSLIGVFELAWCVFLVMALSDHERVKPWVAAGTVALVWALITVFKWGVMVYTMAVSPV